MLHRITSYLLGLIRPNKKPNEYGSELERYIVSRHPQSIYDIEQLTRQFDSQISQGKLL